MRNFALATAAVLLSPSAAFAGRSIAVNGRVLTPDQIAIFDGTACTRVPSGRYWVLPDGAWGYEGFPVIAGYVGELCVRARAAPRRESLSERGLFYAPGELLR